MARKHRQVTPSGRAILLADDDPDYLEATRLLLESQGHRVRCVENGPRALKALQEEDFDLLLLDYFMPGMTGEQVVERLREFDPYIQVVLQTGYSDERPPREMLKKLSIQGYYDKSEGPENLLLWTDAGLKAADALIRVQRSREGLQHILRSTPELHRIQPVQDLLDRVLDQALELLRTVEPRPPAPSASEPAPEVASEPAPEVALDRAPEPTREVASGLAPEFAPESGSGLASEPDAFLALLRGASELSVHASHGRFAGRPAPLKMLSPDQSRALDEALRLGAGHATNTTTILPLRVGSLTLGVVVLEAAAQNPETVALLGVFANQASVAIHNMQLYEVAALDPLTGVHAPRFFEQWLRREVRTAFRSRKPLSLLLVDIDGMRSINDSAGHLIGDQALALAGKTLRRAVRENDVVARYGGDEFVVLLPETGPARAEKVAARILSDIQSHTLTTPDGRRPLSCSIGLSDLQPPSKRGAALRRPVPATYFVQASQKLLLTASDGLSRAQAVGGSTLAHGGSTTWSEPPE